MLKDCDLFTLVLKGPQTTQFVFQANFIKPEKGGMAVPTGLEVLAIRPSVNNEVIVFVRVGA